MIPVDLQTLVMDGSTLPPVITRKSGRPNTLGLRSRGETTIENKAICGNCGKRGHNIHTIKEAASVPLPNALQLPSPSAMEITQEDFDMIQADYERVQMEYGEMPPTEENEIIEHNVNLERECTQTLMEFVSQTQTRTQIESTQESIELTQGNTCIQNKIEQPEVN
jgi:hypothetical protein